MNDETASSKLSDSLRSDSFVRDHLANERTFLAWLRSAMALMGFGVLIARLHWIIPATPAYRGAISAIALGLLLAGIGLAMIPFSAWHYFATRRAVNDNSYQPIGASAVVFAFAIGIAGIGIMIYLFSSPSSVAPPSTFP